MNLKPLFFSMVLTGSIAMAAPNMGSNASLAAGRAVLLCLQQGGVTINKPISELSDEEWKSYLACHTRVQESGRVLATRPRCRTPLIGQGCATE